MAEIYSLGFLHEQSMKRSKTTQCNWSPRSTSQQQIGTLPKGYTVVRNSHTNTWLPLSWDLTQDSYLSIPSSWASVCQGIWTAAQTSPIPFLSWPKPSSDPPDSKHFQLVKISFSSSYPVSSTGSLHSVTIQPCFDKSVSVYRALIWSCPFTVVWGCLRNVHLWGY